MAKVCDQRVPTNAFQALANHGDLGQQDRNGHPKGEIDEAHNNVEGGPPRAVEWEGVKLERHQGQHGGGDGDPRVEGVVGKLGDMRPEVGPQ